MGRISLITGGCRSGKSRLAEVELSKSGAGATYIATCPVIDDEMTRRVARHQKDRAARNWETIEEEIDLASALKKTDGPVLIDCLSLWLNNLMYQAQCQGLEFGEDDIIGPTAELIEAMQARDNRTILVTNEIGMGIVPEGQLSRNYRDALGRISQAIAGVADDVILVVASIPLALKGKI